MNESDFHKFVLSQAEKLLDDSLIASIEIDKKTYIILIITIVILLYFLSYLFTDINTANTLFVTTLSPYSISVLIFLSGMTLSIYFLGESIRPYEYLSRGESVENYEADFDEFVNNPIEIPRFISMKASKNLEINEKKSAALNKAVKILLFSPLISIALYLFSSNIIFLFG